MFFPKKNIVIGLFGIELFFLKGILEDPEEDDGDSIEKVLWHQAINLPENIEGSNIASQPVDLNTNFDPESDWNNIEFYIKWKGHSYLHCQWKPYTELQNVSTLFTW